jgi:hypothetical protein
MGKPRNSLFMAGGQGPFGNIFMGGMFTILKVREGLRRYDEDPGWYDHPAGTVAAPVGNGTPTAFSGGTPAPPSLVRKLAASGQTYTAIKASSCASMSPLRK